MREYPHDVSISLKTMDRSSGHKELYARFKVQEPSTNSHCSHFRNTCAKEIPGGSLSADD